MEKYIINAEELRGLIEDQATFNAIRELVYTDENRETVDEYIQECIEDFGCADMDGVVDSVLAYLEQDKIVEKIS